MTKRVYLPFSVDTREREARLSEFRLAKGLTIDELCALVPRLTPSLYIGLNSGELSPVDRTGRIRDYVVGMTEILDAPLSDLFPRYFCDISEPANIEYSQSVSSFHENFAHDSVSAEERAIKEEGLSWLANIIQTRLTSRERIVLTARLQGFRLHEISTSTGLSNTRVLQLERKAVYRLLLYAHRDMPDTKYKTVGVNQILNAIRGGIRD